MRGVLVSLVLYSLGCGRLWFDPAQDAAAVDVAVDADTSCWPAWRSGVQLAAPSAVTEINTTDNEKNPFLSADGLTLYFATDRAASPGAHDFWTARRDTPNDPFGVVGPVAGVNTSADEGRLEVSDTELTAVFSSNRSAGFGGYDLWYAERPTHTAPFVVNAAATAVLAAAGDEKDPHLLPGSMRLYYTADALEIACADWGGAAYGAAQPVSEPIVTGAVIIADPMPSPDERVLVFSADTGSLGDFYVATRESTAEPFGTATPLATINTPGLERDIFITPDGCEVWYSISQTGSGDNIRTTRVIN